MIIDCISDLHGFYPELEGGDLLIIAGDLTARDEAWQYVEFAIWLNKQNYKKKIIVAGNHDNIAQTAEPFINPETDEWEYLCDSSTVFQGLKIYGSPWTKTFPGMNPHCKAFTCDTEEELTNKFSLIPDDVDILITHSPIYGVLDGIENEDGSLFHVGSRSLRRMMNRIKPKLWVCGHIHEGYGEFIDTTLAGQCYHIVNASHVNRAYKPVNNPIRVVL